jgi:branched-chain amino acid transport system substrate-binding protein
MPLILGEQYIPEKELGNGGFGRTFLAIYRHSTGQTLAAKRRRVLKQLYPTGQMSSGALQTAERLFQEEARALEDLATCRGIRVPQFCGYLTLDAPADLRSGLGQQRYYYLAQEYIAGTDLEQEARSHFDQGRRYSEDEIRDILRQLAEILRHVHAQGRIHRDIKPSNIIRSSQDHQLYLIDFGAVKDVLSLAAGKTSVRHTRIYSPGFSAPEQMRDGTVSEASDLYSLAATCVYLLTNREGMQLETMQRLDPLKGGLWRQERSDISIPLGDLIDCLLQPTPQKRLQSATEVLDHLKPSLPPPPPPVSSVRSFPWKSIGLGLVGLAAIALLIRPLQSLLANGSGSSAPPVSQTSSVPEDPATLAKRISSGQQQLITVPTTPAKEQGITAFAEGRYGEAVALFEQSLKENRNDPETLIYLNNARLRQDSRQTYKIAVGVPIKRLDIAQELLRGVAQAQDEINQQRGIQGIGLEVEILNDDNDPAIARSLAEAVVKDSNILAIVGHNTGDVSLSAAAVYNSNGIVMISPTTFNTEVSKVGNFIFRAAPTTQAMVVPLVDHLFKTVPSPKTFVCIDSQAPDQMAFRDTFVVALTNQGGDLVNVPCDYSSPGFSAETAVDEAIAQGANSLFLGTNINNFTPTLAMVQANRRRLPLFSSPTLYTQEILKDTGQWVEGMVLPAPWSPEAYPNYATRTQQLWGATVNWRTAMAYDATQAVIAGLTQSNNRDGLRQALQDASFSTTGSVDAVRFLPTRDRRLTPILVQAQSDGAGGYRFGAVR